MGVEEYKELYYMDDVNMNIAKDKYKEYTLINNINYNNDKNNFDDNYINIIINSFKEILNEENLIICNLPIVKFNSNVYSFNEVYSLEEIKNHIKNNKKALIYTPIINDNILSFRGKLL